VTRARERAATVAAIGGWIAAFVALWALAGCLASLVYRAGEIGGHRCLRGLPLPSGHLQVGLIALTLAAVLGGIALMARVDRWRRLARAAAVGGSIFGPLLVGTVVVYLHAAPAETMRQDACTGSYIDYTEGLT
jgi:uncharacterized protein YjeT (DUF2065 family)